MRTFITIAGLTLLALSAGCANTRWGFLNKEKERPVTGPPPTKEEIVAYLNANAARVDTLRSDDLHITVHAGAIPIGLSGNLMTQKPRNFRMAGNALGNRVVDLGSNGQEFWWWISKDDPPDQYYCSYKDMEEGRLQSLPFPFQPEWIMETMGLGPYGPADKYQMEHDDFNLKLIERTRSPQGRMVKKVIVMKRSPQAAPNPQVTQYLLLDDASGQELCSAHISQTQVKGGAMLPSRLELRWPAAKVRLDMTVNGVAINSQLPTTAFVRNPMPGVRSRDLAQMFNNPPVMRTQGILNP
jgi:outer membrane lipoprotein-sorting protein